MPTIGSALPSFADAFNINPASIPTVPTPLGAEGVFSTGGTSGGFEKNYGLIKGFDRIGAGFSTNSDNTFYGFNEEQALAGTQYSFVTDQLALAKSKNPSMNIGGALDLLGALMRSKLTLPVLGVNLRYNRMSKKWDQGAGISIAGKVFHFGLSVIRQTSYMMNGYEAPAMTFVNLGLGIKLGEFHLEYSMLTPMNVITASYSGKKLMLTAALRQFLNAEQKNVTQTMVGAQYKFWEKFRLGYLYGYVTEAHSLSAQLLF